MSSIVYFIIKMVIVYLSICFVSFVELFVLFIAESQ